MRSYVRLCTDNRKNASSEFEKDFWKLCVNATFGKSMENVRNRVNVRLIHDPLAGITAVAKPTFVSSKIINDDLVMIHATKPCVTLDKPIFTGFCILELSKVIMYDFHYNHIIKKYTHSNVKLLFTDTDSLCYYIRTANIYKDMKDDHMLYDTSNFEPDHPDPLIRSLYSKTNAKELGKFKSETGSVAPTEFVGLRAKMYSLLLGDKFKMTAKGIKKSFIKHHLDHQTFLNTLRSRRPTEAEFLSFASNNHQLKTLKIKKVGLSAYDDKRFILEDGMSSFAYGHYLIPTFSPLPPFPSKPDYRRGRKRHASESSVFTKTC